MSTEPVIPRPAQEGHEPNTKKKLVHNGNAIEFAKDRKSQGLAGLIMWLPGDAKGVPRDYVSLKHPVVILSPAISATNKVEIVGMTSLGNQDLTKRFKASRKGMKQRAKYLPIEPTPSHPDMPERNMMLKMLPYSPKTPSYVNGSSNSRRTVLFSELAEYLHYDSIHKIYPRFYLENDSYHKLAAFAGFSAVQLLHTPADPEAEVDKQESVEQLEDTTEQLKDIKADNMSTEPPSEDEDNTQARPMDSQPFGLREPRPYHFIPRPPTPPSPAPLSSGPSTLAPPLGTTSTPEPSPPPPTPSTPAPLPPAPQTPAPSQPSADDDVPDDLTPEQERRIDLILQALDTQIRLNPVLSRQASERTYEQEMLWRARMVVAIMEEIAKISRLNDSLAARKSDMDDGRDGSATAKNTGEGKDASNDEAQDQTQDHPMDPEPFGSRNPQHEPYRFIPQPPTPTPSTPAPAPTSAPAPPPIDDDPPPKTFHYMTLEEAKRIRMEDLERRSRLNASSSARASDDWRNRSATATSQGTGKDASRGARDDAKDKAAREDPGDRYRREVYKEARLWWTDLPRRTRLAIKWVPTSAVVGILGWKFWHSQLGGELFTEAVAGSEGLKVVGRGLMGVAVAMARGMSAVLKHCWRHPNQYGGIGLVYGLWLKGKLHVIGASVGWNVVPYGLLGLCAQ
ncbi:hypothetical protein B0T09DRAFT_317902 [Sordaria sp. MPI-SDFR-AT-0083]|nr:hypothetical protein B0T09DRAFT_317902 [Sordaria sp. MPI-SDFR-AT-0083]